MDIKVEGDNSLKNIRKFTKKVLESGLIREIRGRRYHVSKKEKKREKIKAAKRKRLKEKVQSNEKI